MAFYVTFAAKLRNIKEAARHVLPKRWLNQIAKAAQDALTGQPDRHTDITQLEVYEHWLNQYAGADAADMSESDIRDRAHQIASKAKWCKASMAGVYGFFERYGLSMRSKRTGEQWLKRAACERFIRSEIRRQVVQRYERGEIELGLVGASVGAWYCSDKAVKRRRNQLEASEAMMRATVLENESGERINLWEIAKSTSSNKAVRRHELMTRIRGCEEWADENGMVCMFTTNTCPSRFHAQRMGGGRNKKYDGSTPDMAQVWLNATWARCRAQLHREGLRVMGFRVAEPHHDGCPHWHMMLFVKPCDYDAVAAALREHWLREPEQGSEANRLKIVKIDKCKGTAAGYIAKYIAKNIDDHEISHHRDDDFTDGVIEKADSPARRVDAWAACWRIRQFQAIGQPPVTVWRELRRTTREAAAGGSDTLIKAWLSVHRKGERMACWNSYMQAQGGAMCKRRDYKLCSYSIDKTTAGRYGETLQAWTCGVTERGLSEGFVTPTKRQQWGGEGFSATRSVAPWTRLNNCTRARAANRKNLTKTLDAWREFEGIEPDTWEIDPAKAAHYENLMNQMSANW